MNSIYAIVVIFALLVLGGFYVIFDRIATLRNDFNNLELAIQLRDKGQGTDDEPQATSNKGQEVKDKQQETSDVKQETGDKRQETGSKMQGITIPTAIIFETQSSPLLQPQTKLIVTVESAVKSSEGTVMLNLKVFSSDASSYSAVEARDLFERIRLDAENEKPLKAEGQFNSIPPKSAVYGTVTFGIKPSENIFILQVGSGTDLKFYEFDFEKKTYKETVIG